LSERLDRDVKTAALTAGPSASDCDGSLLGDAAFANNQLINFDAARDPLAEQL